MFDKLSAPFPPSAIHWRAQSLTKNKDKALALAYLNARDVMDRLDEVVGPQGWTDTYEETPKGRLICRLSILTPDGDWVMKSDGAGDTAVEGEKGAISDAFKRAAVKWGIGRYLYDLGNVWAPCTTFNDKWSDWTPEAYKLFAAELAKVGRPTTGPISDATRDWIGSQVQSIGKAPADLLDHLSPKSFKDITYEQLPSVQSWIKGNKKAA